MTVGNMLMRRIITRGKTARKAALGMALLAACLGVTASAFPRRPQLQIIPFSLYGARAVWVNGTELVYTSRGNFRFSRAKFEALNLESGRRLAFTPSGTKRGVARLKFTNPPESIEEWLREPTIFVVSDESGNEIDRTYFQTGTLLDSLYRFDGCLGVCVEGGKTRLRVWAPTARSVNVVWVEGNSVAPMQRGQGGTFELSGDSSWLGQGYLFEVEVFSPITGKMEKFRVTDPYSVGLAVNSAYSVVLDLRDPQWKPSGWDSGPRPRLQSRSDAVLYELHVRDFSARDSSVPVSLRGTFGAFALQGTAGDRNLRDLAEAGVTHVHLLPVADFTSVIEDPSQRHEPVISPGLPPDSPLPQDSLGRFRSVDSFNWGYDPFHYLVPEGSYAQNPQGGERVLEFRRMIQALHRKGLRVVLDVVFNHTYAAGLAGESVLDKIVPGYYYRLDRDGQVRNSSCCADTASERYMMEKLMRDSLELWRTQYHVDGFRFDLMNLHSLPTMQRLRDFLRERDPSILLYGEAWPFGSLLEADPGNAFVQSRAYGQSIGVFNDRIRDAIRGGTTDSREKSDPGFVTGLFYDFNHEPANRNTPVDLAQQREKLLWLGDVIRVGMAGNLRDYRFTDHRGNNIQGGDLQFNGGATGFAANPEDTVNYVSAHDGYALWDALQAKLPFRTKSREPETTPVMERVERQILALGLVAFAQGTPFFDAGSEILRSKSGDQNSYDSGDWFNAIDWSRSINGWGLGLPPSFSNPEDWPFWRPRLADPALVAGANEIEKARQEFLAMLKVRQSSPLFRLSKGEQVQARVHFLETELGPMQPPGLIVMEIQDEESDGQDLDPRWRRLLVGVNATNETIVFPHRSFDDVPFTRLYGKGEFRFVPNPQLRLPPRSITVWGETP